MADALRILSRSSQSGSRVALVRDGRLWEYYEDDRAQESLVGAVLLGTVERVLPAVKAAFVRLGLKQNGFLPLREQESFHAANGGASLVTGRDVIVQVKKDEKGDKGVFLTRDITLPGQYVMVMPLNRFIGVSKRIDGERERAKAMGEKLAAGRFGLIVRYAALFAQEKDVAAEAEALYASWQQLSEAAINRKAPSLLLRPDSMTDTLLRDYAARHPCELITCAAPPENLPEGVQVTRLSALELEALWSGLRVENQLDEALNRFVPLKAGGSLMIDQREALQTIDVNSGSAVTAADGKSLALDRNLAAAEEIARQIRLRNLCGIILVDFIDMDTAEEREQVRQAMAEAAADDRVKTVVYDFTALGLLEITRKRTRDALMDILTEGCAKCRESGRIRRQ